MGKWPSATLFVYMVLQGTIVSTPGSGLELGTPLDSARDEGWLEGPEGGDEIEEKVPDGASCWSPLLTCSLEQHLHAWRAAVVLKHPMGWIWAAEAQAMWTGFQRLLTWAYI